MTTHQIPAFNVYGRKELVFTVRRDTKDSSRLFISSPSYAILDAQGVYELCNHLTDMIEGESNV